LDDNARMMDEPAGEREASAPHGATGEILRAFLVLGLTSFGGPIAHLGYFRREFVERRRWLDEHAYADIVALAQFLPGPASSQVGMALGLTRGGLPGALAAWVGFTLPSAIVLVLFANGLSAISDRIGSNWLHGLQVVAVAVVAQALWGMGRTLAPDRSRATVAVAATLIASLRPDALGQVGAIIAGAIAGMLLLHGTPAAAGSSHRVPIRRSTGATCLAIFFVLLLGLPLLAGASGRYVAALVDAFYRAGALVFGGGHVVLPLLQARVVPAGWVSNDAFLAGYGLAQAVPGPLFTFAAFLGAASTQHPSGWAGAGLALVAIFLPGFLLVVGTLPFWSHLRQYDAMRRAMLGINAAVVGLLLAAFYHPVWTSTMRGTADFCLAAAAFLALVFWRVPPWLVVVVAAVVSALGIG
jgi:chromate transporter